MASNLESPRVVAVIQARLGSKRFPRKVLSIVNGATSLEILFSRLQSAKSIDQIVLAIPLGSENDELFLEATRMNIACFRGNETDVLDRFYHAAKSYSPDYVVRITADCPMVDPSIIDQVVDLCINGELKYVSTDETFPDGLDVEVSEFQIVLLLDVGPMLKLTGRASDPNTEPQIVTRELPVAGPFE